MAKKKTSDEKVTRITASTDKKSKKSLEASAPKSKKVATNKKAPIERTPKKGILNIPGALIGYFKGAWYELKQVHWPTRKTTWALTLAVLLFTAFFAALVLLLDAGFKYIFEQILG